jgi:endonuclease YncB( thermonuclease family)
MKKLLKFFTDRKHFSLGLIVGLAIVLALGIGRAFANPYNYKVVKVSDGDTVQFEAPFMQQYLGLKPVLALRVLGVDTPEKGGRAQCPSEDALAQKASAFTKDAVAKAKVIQFEIKDHDKFGGRVLGDVIIDGQRLSELLIKNGYARAYFGEKKQSWCN